MNNNYLDFSKIEPYELNSTNPLIELGNIRVEQHGNNVTLFQKINYIYDGELTKFDITNYDNFYRYVVNFFKYITEKNIKKDKILILGFGIGGMPLKLSQDDEVIQIDSVDSVDNDYRLFRIFKSLIKNPSPKLKYIYNDVNEYLKNPNTTYDIIFDDIFTDSTKVILDYDNIYNSLNIGGYLFINIHTKEQLDDILKRLTKFKKISLIRDNEMLLICQKTNTNTDLKKYLKYKKKYIKLKKLLII
jgi:spermidine synthase